MDIQARMKIVALDKKVAELEELINLTSALLKINNDSFQSILDAIHAERKAA